MQELIRTVECPWKLQSDFNIFYIKVDFNQVGTGCDLSLLDF